MERREHIHSHDLGDAHTMLSLHWHRRERFGALGVGYFD